LIFFFSPNPRSRGETAGEKEQATEEEEDRKKPRSANLSNGESQAKCRGSVAEVRRNQKSGIGKKKPCETPRTRKNANPKPHLP
jgi:hypothetical protein